MDEQDQTYWTAGFLNERFPAPVSPLGWSVVGPLFDRYALRDPLRYMGFSGAERIPATRLYRGHPYANVLVFQILYKPFPDAMLPADAIRYFPEGDTNRRGQAPYPSGLLDSRLVLSLLSHFARDPLNWSPLNFIAWEKYAVRHDRRVAALASQLVRAQTVGEIRALIAGANQAHSEFLKIHRWSLTYADLFFKLLHWLAAEEAQALISDVPTLTRQVNIDLQALAAYVQDKSLRLDTLQGIKEAERDNLFVTSLGRLVLAHGHRSSSLDIAAPTLAEDPVGALRLVAGTTAVQRDFDGAGARRQVRSRLNPTLRLIFDVVLDLARRYAALREDQRYYWHKSLAVSRGAYLRLADWLLKEGSLANPEDIFYATADEITAWTDGHISKSELTSRIRARQSEWGRYWTEYRLSPSGAYPAFLYGTSPLEQKDSARTDSWKGRGISPGIARGIVRVVLEPGELAHVATGEVLVAPATDPGWTPVFSRLSALALERGGVLAHGAILAREHHLPAVAGIPHLTRELKDGDWVEVDGTQGTVRRLHDRQGNK